MLSGPSSSSSSQAVAVVSSPESESNPSPPLPSEATTIRASEATTTEKAYTTEALAEESTFSAAPEISVSADDTLSDDTLPPTATHTHTAPTQQATVPAVVVDKAREVITPFDFPPEAFDLG